MMRGGEATIAKEIEDQKKAMLALRKNTEEISQVVQAGNLDQVIQKSQELGSNVVTETEKIGTDKGNPTV